jgi:hypothetical protein
MMQELAGGLRGAGLNIFRHRRGMLFVSPIRARVFNHESTGVSASINAILETVTSASGINRKILAEHLAPAGAEPADLERAKLALASDLHWLVSEGYIIEFNDGSLDLPRTKPAAGPAPGEKPAPAGAATVEPKSEAEPVVKAESEVQPTEPIAEAPSVVEGEREGAPEPAPATINATNEPEATNLDSESQPAPQPLSS